MYLVGKGSSPNFGTALVQRIQGLGAWGGMGCACGSSCSGGCKVGLGLFDSGTDFKSWGPMEWGVVGVGAFALFSMLSTSRRGVRAVRGGIRSRQSKTRKKQALQQRRAELDRELKEL